MSGYDLYLSYSARKAYLTCPKRYSFMYVDKVRGVKDPKNTLFGSVMGRIVENFYTQRFWATPDPTAAMREFIGPATEAAMERERK